MQLPKQVNIMGITYKVVEVPVINKGEWILGQIDYAEQIIKIDNSLSDEKKGQVFMHELLHGVLETIGQSELNEDENAVQRIASTLYHVLSSQTIFS